MKKIYVIKGAKAWMQLFKEPHNKEDIGWQYILVEGESLTL